MGGSPSREEQRYGYAPKQPWVVQTNEEQNEHECCIGVATAHVFRPPLSSVRGRRGNPQDAHDVNAWDGADTPSAPGTPVAPLRNDVHGWSASGFKGGGSGGSGGMRGSSSCMDFGTAQVLSDESGAAMFGRRSSVTTDDAMGGRRHRSFSSLKKVSSYCENGKTMESGLRGRRNVSFGTLSIARIDSRELLSKTEKKSMWYDRQDVGSFVVNELMRRRDIGVTSTSALCPEAAGLDQEPDEVDDRKEEPLQMQTDSSEEKQPEQMQTQVQPEPYLSESLGQNDNEGLVVF